MAKYSFEFKKKVVLEYINGEVAHSIFLQSMGLDQILSSGNGLLRIKNSEMKD